MKTNTDLLRDTLSYIVAHPENIPENALDEEETFFTNISFSDSMETTDPVIQSREEERLDLKTELLGHYPGLNTENQFLEYYYDFFKQIPEYWMKRTEEAPFSYFETPWPTYYQMNRKQSNYYFYWRDQFRKGNILETDTGYLKLFVYELLSMASEDNLEEIYTLFTRILTSYLDEYPHLTATFGTWFFDFLIHHHLESRITELPEELLNLDQRFSNYLIQLQLLNADEGQLPFNLIESLSDYKISESRFYSGHEEETQRLIPRVFSFVNKYYKAVHHLNLFESYLNPESARVRILLYPGAITPETGKAYLTEIYSFSTDIQLKSLITQVLKYTENELRKKYHFRGRLKNINLDTDLSSRLKAFIQRELSQAQNTDRTLSERPLDLKAIAELRTQSDIVRKSLEVEDEIFQESAEIQEPKSVPDRKTLSSVEKVQNTVVEFDNLEIDEELQTFFKALQDYQLETVRIIQGGQDTEARLRALAEENLLLPDLLIDEINELAYEYLDNLFIENDGDLRITEEYLEIIENLEI